VLNLSGLSSTDARRLACKAIVSALYSAYGSGEQLGTGLILEEIKSPRPLSRWCSRR